MPRSLGGAAEAVLAAARGQADRLRAVVDRSRVPMVIVDGGRRYVEVNRPARLAFRASLAEMRGYVMDDLTPPHALQSMEAIWARLLETGCVTGPFEIAGPDGGRLDVVLYGLANAVPDLQLAAEGLSGPAIAKQLVVSPATVKAHFSNIYEKLGVSGRVGAVARGMRFGLVD